MPQVAKAAALIFEDAPHPYSSSGIDAESFLDRGCYLVVTLSICREHCMTVIRSERARVVRTTPP